MTNPKIKDALVSFFRTWVVATLVVWLPGLFGWLNDVTAWARDQGATPFPDAHGLAYLAVAAIVSAFISAGMALLRLLENGLGVTILPRPAGPQTVPPANPTPPEDRGAVDTRTIAILALIVAVVVLIILLA